MLLTRNVFLFIAALLLGASAYAESPLSGDSKEPIEITADKLEVEQQKQLATFSGNVRAVQGSVVLKAAEMLVHYSKDSAATNKESKDGGLGEIKQIDAVGSVFMTTKEETAQGAKAIYFVDARKILLQGNVVLTRDGNILKGNRLEYSFDTGKSLLTSSEGEAGSSGRVKAVFAPKKQ